MSNNIGRFEILGELSRSPMGAVYKASDPESGQTIALKTVVPEALGEESATLIQSVLEETAGIQGLSSHNLTQLFGAQEMDGLFCAAMEYVQGNSIATMLARKEGFSIWDLQDIARQSCQGLDHAHTHNAVHYSLEPAKIMVTWDGTVKILSFGISCTGAFGCLAAGKAPETLHYMSPEQLRGERMDARSNLFSLGAILYEMVTEHKAFPGEDAEQVRQQIFEQMPPSPTQVNPKLHPALGDVIMKALAKAPEMRYQNGQELINDLERCKESPAKTAPKKPAQTAKSAQPQKSATPASAAPKAWPTPAEPQKSFGKLAPERANSEFAASPADAATAAEEASAPMDATGLRATAPAWKAAAAGFGGETEITSADPARTPKLDSGEQFISTCVKASVEAFSQSSETLSSTPAARPQSTPPRIAVDPMMAEANTSSTARRQSFSEISELPPLKEVYVQPPSASEAPAGDPFPKAGLRNVAAPKPKVQPRHVAKKTVAEIKKTPPKLFMYSVTAAVAVVLTVVMAIAFHLRSQNTEDSAQSPATAPKVAESSPATSQEQVTASPAEPAPTALQAEASDGAPTTSVSVTPKYNRKKVKTPAAVPAVIPGQMTVNSTPEGAEVSLDGRHDPNWVTPFNMGGLVPGQHAVKVSKQGFSAETRSIEVASGSKSFLVVQLAPLTATVSVSSEPSGAAVFMDGRDTGRLTPAQISVDKPGSHTFVVKKQGYLEDTTTTSLQAGQVFRFAPSLRALGATDDIKIGGGKFKKIFGGGDTAGMVAVSLKTQPKGAQVAVNNRILDKPSPVEFYLNPGAYVIDVTMTGYKEIHRVINVEKGSKVTLDEAMERE